MVLIIWVKVEPLFCVCATIIRLYMNDTLIKKEKKDGVPPVIILFISWHFSSSQEKLIMILIPCPCPTSKRMKEGLCEFHSCAGVVGRYGVMDRWWIVWVWRFINTCTHAHIYVCIIYLCCLLLLKKLKIKK